jgi:hypothetical protein
MANFVRRWTASDIEKLQEMAGKQPRKKIAAELGRAPGAIAVKAHQLRISLRCGQSDHTAENTGPRRMPSLQRHINSAT